MSRLDDRGDPEVFTDHNVYILGAGFSWPAGIPLLNDFLMEMRSSMNWLSSRNRHRELQAIRDVLIFRKNASGAALRVNLNVENIEDLFSLAAASGQYPLAEAVSTAIAATLSHARGTSDPHALLISVKKGIKVPKTWEERVGATDVIKYMAPFYDLCAGMLVGKWCEPRRYMKNTVITFNYDTVLEEALANIDVKCSYEFDQSTVEYDKSAKHIARQREDTVLPICKLHGSVNWAMPLREKGKLRIFGGYDDLLSADRQVLLIPPTWRKTFGGPLTTIWDAAVKALTEATRIIIVGFSIPPTDIHFKYLLAAGLQENISLRKIYCLNPDGSVEQNLFSILRSDLKDHGFVKFYGSRCEHLFTDHTDQNYFTFPRLFERHFADNITFG